MSSPERDVEKGAAGRDTTGNSSTDNAQEGGKPSSWDRFHPWLRKSPLCFFGQSRHVTDRDVSAGEQSGLPDRRDPRVIALLQALVPATAIFDVSPSPTTFAIGRRVKEEVEAWERVLECLDYEGEEYEMRVEDFMAKHDARGVLFLLSISTPFYAKRKRRGSKERIGEIKEGRQETDGSQSQPTTNRL